MYRIIYGGLVSAPVEDAALQPYPMNKLAGVSLIFEAKK